MTAKMVPTRNELARLLDEGLTQQQIADRWEQMSGVRVTRSAIAMAIERYGLKSAHPRPRYDDLLPWLVHEEHARMNDARMLRLEARRRRGESLTEKDLRILDAWLRLLAERKAVVHYDGDTPQGFWWVGRTNKDEDIIRRPKRGTVEAGTHDLGL